MRPTLLALVMVPVLAQATILLAAVNPPMNDGSPTARAATASTKAVMAAGLASHPGFRETIREQLTPNFAEAAMAQGGTLEYDLTGSVATQAAEPKLVKVTEVPLTQAEVAAQPRESEVDVKMVVDANGFPRDLQVAHSAGAAIDQRALQTISQYRFAPGTIDNKAVETAVTVKVKIERR